MNCFIDLRPFKAVQWMLRSFLAISIFVLAVAAALCITPLVAFTQNADHVIHISVDGLRPDAVTGLGPVNCPNFHRLMIEGAFTLNARADCDYTNTLPNHTCQMTGRNVLGPDGHGVSFNSDTGGTIEDAHGSYVAGVFDVTHDSGLITALYCGKEKFALFDRSWNAVNGAADITGENNGTDKIDHYLYLYDTSALVDAFLSLLDSAEPGYSLLHLRDPDTDGHAYGWESPEYLDAVIRMDAFIGMVIAAVEDDPALSSSTAIVVTADHGGTAKSHSNPANPSNYRIPYFAWGPGIPAGADIYLLNTASRLDPGAGRPDCDASVPPVRNGDTANLAGSLLGLPPVQDSTIGYAHDLAVTASVPLPSVTITSPPDGSDYGPDETISIEVDASSSDGISKVEFFTGWGKIGEDDTPPYELLWDELPLGVQWLTARAVDGNSYAATDRSGIEIVSTTSVETADFGKWDQPRVYPNPAGASPSLYMHISVPGLLEILLFDAAGRIAGKHSIRSLPAGSHVLELDMRGYPSGVYFFRAVSSTRIRNGKFVLIR